VVGNSLTPREPGGEANFGRERPWPELDEAALYGLAGDVVTRARLDSHVPTDEVGESRRN
jgi:hypothetical protein